MFVELVQLWRYVTYTTVDDSDWYASPDELSQHFHQEGVFTVSHSSEARVLGRASQLDMAVCVCVRVHVSVRVWVCG